MEKTAFVLTLSPLVSNATLIIFAALALFLLILGAQYYRRGLLLRSLVTATFYLLLLNPSLAVEQRTPAKDVAILVVDHSPSQSFGQRRARTDFAAAYIRQQLNVLPNLELRVVDSGSGAMRETRLFDKLDEAFADVPAGRRAGVIMITDGQVHDVPATAPDYGTLHVLLSGEHQEQDRQLIILEAPSYGIVGQKVTIRYRITDGGGDRGAMATLLLRQDNAAPQMVEVPVDTDQTATVTVAHSGQNIVDLEAAPLAHELTLANNRVPLIINGVRDRLKVLLVSGQPYAGGRTWRNILTADPSVDLVHFTILREPNKIDATPQNELALIEFPFQELFETKLKSFDLIIFDRYRSNGILPNYYFGNIARYVQDGGALLVTDGPSYIGDESLYNTDLAQVLPARPANQLLDQPFKPTLTALGRRHPVTQNLPDETSWGEWLHQVAVTPDQGDVLMSGVNNLPLLILAHANKGRVAEIASDQIWLWARGHDGGGPHAELLRRLIHWLMKEPELEENALNVTADNDSLLIRRRSLTDQSMNVTVTAPDGGKNVVALKTAADGSLQAQVPAAQLGVYTVNDGTQERFALVGALNPPELSGVRTTAEKLAPVVRATKGTTIWLADTAQPEIRSLSTGHSIYGGSNWLALRRNNAFTITGATTRPLLPVWFAALALLALIICAWWREGRNQRH